MQGVGGGGAAISERVAGEDPSQEVTIRQDLRAVRQQVMQIGRRVF